MPNIGYSCSSLRNRRSGKFPNLIPNSGGGIKAFKGKPDGSSP